MCTYTEVQVLKIHSEIEFWPEFTNSNGSKLNNRKSKQLLTTPGGVATYH